MKQPHLVADADVTRINRAYCATGGSVSSVAYLAGVTEYAAAIVIGEYLAAYRAAAAAERLRCLPPSRLTVEHRPSNSNPNAN